jgi:hypothetical protein
MRTLAEIDALINAVNEEIFPVQQQLDVLRRKRRDLAREWLWHPGTGRAEFVLSHPAATPRVGAERPKKG